LLALIIGQLLNKAPSANGNSQTNISLAKEVTAGSEIGQTATEEAVEAPKSE